MTGLLERLASVKRPESSVTIEGIPGGPVEFKMRAVGHTKAAVLIASNPPSRGNEVEKEMGFNPATYYRAVIRECCYAIRSGDETVTLRDEDGKPTDAVDDAWWERFFAGLNSAQFDKLFGGAWTLDGVDAVPSSAPGSPTSQPDAESLTLPAAGESPRNGSTAGSRSKSRRTSTTKQAD